MQFEAQTPIQFSEVFCFSLSLRQGFSYSVSLAVLELMPQKISDRLHREELEVI